MNKWINIMVSAGIGWERKDKDKDTMKLFPPCRVIILHSELH